MIELAIASEEATLLRNPLLDTPTCDILITIILIHCDSVMGIAKTQPLL